MTEWWLISKENVDKIKGCLDGDALMHLETGLHKTDVKPYDM